MRSQKTTVNPQNFIASTDDVLHAMKSIGKQEALKGMSRFGIKTENALGLSVPQLRALAKKIGMKHELAESLWRTGIHEARILAGMIDDPVKVTSGQMERWVTQFDSWDVVDGACGNLFDKTPFAVEKAKEWTAREAEYEKRAGFVLMAELAVHDKKMPDKTFLEFLPFIVREASDERNFVKKAINWALRQIGKRNLQLNAAAIRTCKQLHTVGSRSARWIAADAMRELTSPSVQKRLKGQPGE